MSQKSGLRPPWLRWAEHQEYPLRTPTRSFIQDDTAHFLGQVTNGKCALAFGQFKHNSGSSARLSSARERSERVSTSKATATTTTPTSRNINCLLLCQAFYDLLLPFSRQCSVAFQFRSVEPQPQHRVSNSISSRLLPRISAGTSRPPTSQPCFQ